MLNSGLEGSVLVHWVSGVSGFQGSFLFQEDDVSECLSEGVLGQTS